MTEEGKTSHAEKQVITACALIHHNFNGVEKIFMPRRAETKKFLPGVFELPGGHVELGEDIIEGLKREIIEEFGMHVNVGDPFMAFTYEYEAKAEHTIEVDYFATFIEPIGEIQLDLYDHSEFIWIGPDDVHKMYINRPEDDPEIKAVKRGLAFLNGESIDFGTRT